MDVHVLVEKQRQEIDILLSVQNEKFKSVLQQLISQHIPSVLKKKDEEIAKANTKMMELKNHVWKLETENQLWQRPARDAEAAVVALKSALERVGSTGELVCLPGSESKIEILPRHLCERTVDPARV
ncbi:hypothetical protein QJS10_CPA01g00375 [Acorus calamus]|uniref:Uncharacterized protein n=1 Tax=Acorus calamus TaxID=4465 RepID=A0AAV9FJK7_ACOCL|nr:hypothetical protein QJS10_CPA01g00375 [Acorus calamus]